MNGNSKTVLGVLAGVVIGAFAVFLGTNPKAQKTMRDGGTRIANHARKLGARARNRRNDVA